jgi:DNA repair protein RecN (Recombination protein N)
MLTHLTIRNYALIKELDMGFTEGFAVITGETGAGKSILLGALALILGQRADISVLNEKEKKCIVEGTFQITNYGLNSLFESNGIDYQDETTLRREINPGGNSRAFINDSPVTLNVMKELGEKLVNIHSQYQTFTLNDASFQLTILDNYAGLLDEVIQYRNDFDGLSGLKQEMKALRDQNNKLQSEQEYYLFHFDELEKANLQEGELEEIENELEILENAEEIKSNLFLVVNKMDRQEQSLLGQLRDISTTLTKLVKYFPLIQGYSIRLEDAQVELKDIVQEIERIEAHIDVDPQRLSSLKERLDYLNRLQHKHRVKSIRDLIVIKDDFQQKLHNIHFLEDKIIVLEKEIALKSSEIMKKAREISAKRHTSLSILEKELVGMIRGLGMPDTRFKILLEMMAEPGRDGLDQVLFLFNANRGGELKELSAVASGGERSRLMLCLKSLIAKKTLLPTIVFDEIDMGVSGEIAGKMGNILQQMANHMQVISITHLPQIAAKGNIHYLVYKEIQEDTAQTYMKKLVPEERLQEIAKMISDQSVTASAINVAKELLKDQIDFSNRQLSINI